MLDHNEKIKSYIDSPEKQRRLYKRTLIIVMISQILSGAGLAAGVTVGALLAQDMLGTESFAGIPIAVFTLGSAAAALLVGRLTQRFGRRQGLVFGFLAGGIGSLGVVIGAVLNSIILLLISLFVYGAGGATNLLARYAGTDLASDKQRGTAISLALVSTTFGAVAGPNMVDIMSKVAESVGAPALTGTFILAGAAYTLAGIMILVFLRPDPFVIAKAVSAAKDISAEEASHSGNVHDGHNKRGVAAGAAVMVISQFVMIAVMTITPVHMGHYGHDLKEVGVVIGIHIAAMFLPSLVTGILVDKVGRRAMVIASAVTLLASGVLAAMGPGDSLVLLTLSLALLGLGWNFGLISGTAIIVDSTDLSTRAKTQGAADVLIALSGATGGALSGVVIAHSSFTILSLLGGLLSLVLLPVVVWGYGKQNV